jgi:hypothetical protein
MDALRQAEAAEFLGDGQAEDAHLGQFLDHSIGMRSVST